MIRHLLVAVVALLLSAGIAAVAANAAPQPDGCGRAADAATCTGIKGHGLNQTLVGH